MGILKYIITGNPHSNDSGNAQRKQEKFEKKLDVFMESDRVKNVLNEYGFSSEKLKDIIERNYRLGIYNIIFLLRWGKFLWKVLDIYTKSPNDWTEEDKFIAAHNILNKYNIYK